MEDRQQDHLQDHQVDQAEGHHLEDHHLEDHQCPVHLPQSLGEEETTN
jgi:hypothetical protein